MVNYIRVQNPLRIDPTTFHTSKLVVSSDQVLCGQCQRLLQGENTLLRTDETNGRLHFAHHTTAESFLQALSLPCGICRRLRVKISRDLRHYSRGPFQAAPTEYVTKFEADREEGLSIWFTCNRSYVPLHLVAEQHDNLLRENPSTHTGASNLGTSLTADNTGSEACISFALSRFRRCQDTHTECWKIRQSRRQMGTFVPTRVLDVGHPEAPTIRLLESEDGVKTTPYIALSHCWGGSQPFKLIRTTASRLRAGIPLTELPKTFRNAIHVAQKMQIQYLWIDSLCIIQDDPEDWQREAARMRDVYSQAVCCIAASSAQNSDAGLFFDRDPQALLSMRVETTRDRIYGQNTREPLVTYVIIPDVNTPEQILSTAPLNKRAWVAQERYLSTGMFHFTQELIYWECHEELISEQNPDHNHHSGRSSYSPDGFIGQSLKWWVNDYKIKMTLPSTDKIEKDLDYLFRIYEYWCAFRHSYSGLGLTMAKDILVALNGVAQDVAGEMNDTLVAGLWRGRFIEDMCWARTPIPISSYPADKALRSVVWRAPTWSWASTSHPAERWVPWSGINRKSKPAYDMAVIDHLLVDQRPSGELVHASMTLRCRPILIFPPESALITWEPYDNTMVLDDPTKWDLNDLGYEVSLVVLRHCCYGSVEEGYVQAILVTPSQTKSGSYERVGSFAIEADSGMLVYIDFDKKAPILRSVLDGYHKAKEMTIDLI